MFENKYVKPFVGLAIAAPMSFGISAHSVIVKNLTQFNPMTLVTCRYFVLMALAGMIAVLR